MFVKFLREEGIEEIYPGTGAAAKTPESAIGEPAALRQAPSDPGPGAGAAADGKTGGAKERLLALREQVLKCTLCGELARTRHSVVFGAGNLKAGLLFVGEAPGRDEDMQGLPFVGRAGQLLTKIIESIGLDRQQVFICNVLKCRPPNNRPPQPDEILNCEPYLKNQIALIRPKLICALGTFAAQTLLKTGQNISSMRGRTHLYEGIPVICTYHPAYLLRNPGEKRKVWEDMKTIKTMLENDAGE